MSQPTGSSNGSTTQVSPQFIMDDVKLLFQDLTSPEAGVKFTPPSRGDTSTIQNTINPPAVTWVWANQASRAGEPVTQIDVGKYGYETDSNTLFQLIAVSPSAWQPVQTGTTSTWTWANLAARINQPVTAADVGKVGLQSDINTLFRLVSATPAVWQPVPNPNNTSSPFELSTGAADADSFHDFYRLQIAFEDVWSELLDTNVQKLGEQLYAAWDAQMNAYDDTGQQENALRKAAFPNATQTISSAGELQEFVDNLKIVLGIGVGPAGASPAITQLKNALIQSLQASKMLLHQLDRVGNHKFRFLPDDVWDDSTAWREDTAQNTQLSKEDIADLAEFPGQQRQQIFDWIIGQIQVSPSGGDVTTFNDLPALLKALDKALGETYRLDIFAPASINFGLLLNYRQHWQPQSYQAGNLVSSIPLAPQEIRRFTTKKVVKRTRSVKEIDDSLRSGKDERSETSRVDSEIVDRAKNQTNFQKTASGSFGNDALYKVSTSLQQGGDQAVESAQTKREFHEAVVKSAQEYRNEHRLEIETQETREDESTSFQEIRNPNDELTVTYLFYELQRRYLVDEALHKVTPVVFVANDVPAPNEIDSAWILRHDWILKRTILDDSFLAAIDYLATSYTGEEVTLQVLELSVEQQKGVVDNISQQVSLANTALTAATLGMTKAENQDVADLQQAEQMSIVKSVFDPLGITKSGNDGNSDRARVDFAKDAFNRAQSTADRLTANLKSETTALQVAIDKYTAAATRHFSMLAEIDRLGIHIKDNMIYYMQAIWTYEPGDKRYFRIYNYEVPVFGHNSTVSVANVDGLAKVDLKRTNFGITFPRPTLLNETRRLHQVADIDNLLGFKGNYMIFPLVVFDYMTWFQMQNYLHLDDINGITANDPDPNADLTLDELKAAMADIHEKDPATFTANQAAFEEIMLRLLSTQDPELVIVPSASLYIEALPGTHPLLEDFKLIHRAIDVKRAQADARKAELENLRLGARISNGELGDPDIDKVIVVGTGQNVTVDAGQ